MAKNENCLPYLEASVPVEVKSFFQSTYTSKVECNNYIVSTKVKDASDFTIGVFLYDQKEIEKTEFIKKINSIISDYECGSGSIPQERLCEIKKEAYLLAPFINSRNAMVNMDDSFDGIVITLKKNKSNTFSITSSGEHRMTFTYLFKVDKKSISIDGYIDLDEDDDNINYLGLKKLISMYGRD